MENFPTVSHIRSMRRNYPHVLSVTNIGYNAKKKEWIQRAFETFNFSFILSGGGDYMANNKQYKVIAPCVITQWPGQHVEYGPGGNWNSWEELYFIHPAECLPELQHIGYANPEKPIWPIHNLLAFNKALHELRTLLLLVQKRKLLTADSIERQCDKVILESLSTPSLTPHTSKKASQQQLSTESRMDSIRSALEKDCLQAIDFEAIARRHGFSQSAFHRHWQNIFGIPPARYVSKLRIQESSRLLVETDLPIKTIAHQVGYEDPLYFSKCFKKQMNIAPSDYRKQQLESL